MTYNSQNVILTLQNFSVTDWHTFAASLRANGTANAFAYYFTLTPEQVTSFNDMDAFDLYYNNILANHCDFVGTKLAAGKIIWVGSDVGDFGNNNLYATALVISLKKTITGMYVIDIRIKHVTE